MQVLDGATVVASSANVQGIRALATPGPDEQTIVPAVPFVDGPFVATSATRETARGTPTVVVGVSLDDVVEARNTLVHALWLGVPGCWWWSPP